MKESECECGGYCERNSVNGYYTCNKEHKPSITKEKFETEIKEMVKERKFKIWHILHSCAVSVEVIDGIHIKHLFDLSDTEQKYNIHWFICRCKQCGKMFLYDNAFINKRWFSLTYNKSTDRMDLSRDGGMPNPSIRTVDYSDDSGFVWYVRPNK